VNLGQRGRKLLGLRPRDGLERRFVLLRVPDLSIILGLAARPQRQHDPKGYSPGERSILDHALVGQKLLEIFADGFRGRLIRRAEIHEQDADAAERHVGMILGPMPYIRLKAGRRHVHDCRTM
jgi:hypothetical protein